MGWGQDFGYVGIVLRVNCAVCRVVDKKRRVDGGTELMFTAIAD